MICAKCGEENPERFRLCGFCGAELPKVVATEARKVVTLVFADVSGSTALGERLDPESVRWVMSSFFETAREVLERHGGTVEKFIGDAVMAAFGIPSVREDDALRGVRAAAELRDRLRELGREVEGRYGTGIGVRIGVNTGEVVAGDAAAGQMFASGDAVNVAARLEQAAAPGEVLLGQATVRLVRDAVTLEEAEPLALKGKSEPVAAWRLIDVAAGRRGVERRFDAPLVGREAELARLLEAWQATVDAQDALVVTIVAPAGTGKTRLIAELVETVQPEAHVLIGRCLPYGDGITFWPIAEAVRQAAGIVEDDALAVVKGKVAALVEGTDGADELLERLSPAIGLLGPRVALEETFWAIRRLFETLARRRPLLVVLDDVHWAEETLLDLIEYLGWTRGVPLLLVCSARPELLERRPSMVGPRANSNTLLLEPLGADGADELMIWQLGAAPLPEMLRTSVLAAAEGNPLFVQELVRMLIDDGVIVRRNGDWQATTDVRMLAMPATIQALLAARLDQLDAAERDVAQRASVVGHVFWSGAVRDLCRETSRHGLGSRLHTLVRKALIVPEASTLAAEDAFRFGHILIRDAAYAGLAKRTRAELHERFANWLEATRGGRAAEYDEILGYHLEQAAAYRHELGETAHAERVAAEASARLAGGGRRARASGDLPAAANLLGRAADLLPARDAQRIAIRLEAIPALYETGRLEQADAGLEEILAHAGSSRLLVAARAWRGFIDTSRALCTYQDGELAAQAWLSASEQADDHAGQATALGFIALMNFFGGRSAVADDFWQSALEQAVLAGDALQEDDSLVWLLASGTWGPLRVDLALERCDAIARREGASRKVRAMASVTRGVLEAMGGHFARGRESVAQGRQELEDLGTWLAIGTGLEAATVEILAEDFVAAEAMLRPSIVRFQETGNQGAYSTQAGILAHVLYAQDRLDEARSFMKLCLTAAGDDDIASQHLWRGVLAKLTARAGDHATALQLADEAIALAAATDLLSDHAERLVDISEVHALAGRTREAVAALDHADALYARKGCVAALSWTAKQRSALTGNS